METSNERRERKRAKKTEGRPQIFGLGADFCLSATELVSIRTTRLPGDAFNGPARTDTDLMRQQRRGDGDGDADGDGDPLLTTTAQKQKPTDRVLQWTVDTFTRVITSLYRFRMCVCSGAFLLRTMCVCVCVNARLRALRNT